MPLFFNGPPRPGTSEWEELQHQRLRPDPSANIPRLWPATTGLLWHHALLPGAGFRASTSMHGAQLPVGPLLALSGGTHPPVAPRVARDRPAVQAAAMAYPRASAVARPAQARSPAPLLVRDRQNGSDPEDAIDTTFDPIEPSRNPKNRDHFRDALRTYPGLSRAKRRIFDRIFEFEGGDKVDRSSGALTGITPRTLDDYRKWVAKQTPGATAAVSQLTHLPLDPEDLTREQRIRIMNWYARTQMDKLDIDEIAIPSGPHVIADPKLAGQIFDMFYQYGPKDASFILQRGINDALKTYRNSAIEKLVSVGVKREDAVRMTNKLTLDDTPGSLTRDAITTLLKVGLGNPLRRLIDARRRRYNRCKSAGNRYSENDCPNGTENSNDRYRREQFD